MPTSKAMAVWEGKLKDGKGTFKAGSGAFSGPYSFATRFEGKAGTNPEELIAAADGSLYTGITNDLARRLAAHRAGTASRYTRSRRPVRLVYRERRRDRSAALRREAAIKRLPRAAKLRIIGA